MTYKFDEKLLAALRPYRWHPQRKVSANKYISDWQNGGYRVFQQASEFSESFGGIKISHPAYSGNGADESSFDPSMATRRLDRPWVVEVYEKLADELLLPVGQGYSGHLTFLIGDRGGLYGAYDDYFCRVGKSVEIAIANILFAPGNFEKLSA